MSPDESVIPKKTRHRSLRAHELDRHIEALEAILRETLALDPFTERRLTALLRRHPRDGNSLYGKSDLVRAYKRLCEMGRLEHDSTFLARIQAKPIRTISGVAPVSVLTKPYPCPGECIFCPTDERMPKSYLHDEPAAMRAERNAFDPYRQTAGRIEAFAANGHPVDKVELLILGGTWSAYSDEYQEWFIRRCFDAMNESRSDSIEDAHRANEAAAHRNVGLVIETRPDLVTPEEVRRLRMLGVTKVQLGAQSFDDAILEQNRRGHTVEATRRAVAILRAAGLKVVLHWMPNLLGATPASDREDFRRMWSDPGLRPDEIKIYSTALLENSDLHAIWLRGEYRPYVEEDLIELLVACKAEIPPYCRINRLYRDIPTTRIVEGTKRSNLRQVVQDRLRARGLRCGCVRCREVGTGGPDWGTLALDEIPYATRDGEERFLSFQDANGRLAGYARLYLPDRPGFSGGDDLGITELGDAALIREVHVYGPSLRIGQAAERETQHRGLGTRLIEAAEERARGRGFVSLAIIAAVGTRRYYAARGYERTGTYMVRTLDARL